MQENATPPNRIRELRKGKPGCRLRDLAQLLDRGEAMVSRYERGDAELGIELARKLAEYFDVTVEYLMGWDRESPTKAAA